MVVKHRPRALVPALVPLAILGLVASLLVSREDHHPPRADAPRHPCAQLSRPFTGAVVASPQSRSLAKLAAFGIRPDVVESYAAFGKPFNAGQADPAEAVHAVPVIQIDPREVSVAAIASGHKNAYLRTYAKSVRAFRCPIVLSFGHEMNGNWYSWGWHHVKPATFIAAWRDIVTVFRSEHVSNVTWMWTPNRYVPGTSRIGPPSQWWPGGAYVNWVGIDAYYSSASETFGTLLDETLSAIQKLTSDPVVIAETGVWPGSGQASNIGALFNGAEAAGMSGIIYFDLPGREAWQLASSSALVAFSNAVRSFG
jgi:mannan endo-1,4-beta-mannosidase